MTDIDDGVFATVFDMEGGTDLQWETATRCPNIDPETKQPTWDCNLCWGSGVIFAAPVTVRALFRSQSRWLSFREEGELDHGQATLTTPLDAQPGYTDRRVRDRYTVPADTVDELLGRVFYPAAPAVPFNFAGVQRAWRVQLQSASQANRLVPQR